MFLYYKPGTQNRPTNLVCGGTSIFQLGNTAAGYGNDFASSPATIQVLQQPAAFIAPSLSPQMSMSFQVMDSFRHLCSGRQLDTATVKFVTEPPMYANSAVCDDGLQNGTLSVSSASTCSFGIVQATQGTRFAIRVSGSGILLGGVTGAATNAVSVADCGGALSHCQCNDPLCGCQNATAVNDFTCVISRTKWLRKLTPMMAPCGVSTLVTLLGSFDQPIVNCSIDGVMSKALNPSSSQVQCMLPPVTSGSCHLAATPVKVSSDKKLSDSQLNVYRYGVSSLGAIDITDAYGKSPARGLFTGGVQTRDPIKLHGTEQIRHLFALASSGKISAIETLTCQFEMDEGKVTTSAWTSFWRPKSNSTTHYSFAECDPPPSYSGATGVGGDVTVQLSLDTGQHWLPVVSNYTYLCNKDDFYIPSPVRGLCTPCPTGAICQGGPTVVAMGGWFPVHSPLLFQKCMKREACENRAPGQLCAAPYAGPLCALCEPGFGSKFDFKCQSCVDKLGSNVNPVWWLIGYSMLSAGVAGFFTKLTIDQAEADDDKFRGRFAESHPLLVTTMTGISMYQSISFLASFNYVWPGSLSAFLDASRTVSGSLQLATSLQCHVASITSDYVYANVIIAICIGPVCIICCGFGLAVLHVVRLVWGLGFRKHYNFKMRMEITAMYVIFLFVPGAVKAILMLFTCHKVGDDHRLFYQMDIDCNSERHRSWQWGAGLCGLFYAVCIPAFKWWELRSAEEGILNQDEHTLRELGFVINGFHPQFYYWQLCVKARKLVTVALITLSKPYGVVVQAQLGLIVFVVAIVAHVRCLPFKNPVVNVLELISILSFMITAWTGVLMSLETVPEGWKPVLSVFAFLVNVFASFALVGVFIYAFRIEYGEHVETALDKAKASEWRCCFLKSSVDDNDAAGGSASTDLGDDVELGRNAAFKDESLHQRINIELDDPSSAAPTEQPLPAIVRRRQTTPVLASISEMDPSQLSYLQLKKWLLADGCPNSEVDAASEKDQLLQILRTRQMMRESEQGENVKMPPRRLSLQARLAGTRMTGSDHTKTAAENDIEGLAEKRSSFVAMV